MDHGDPQQEHGQGGRGGQALGESGTDDLGANIDGMLQEDAKLQRDLDEKQSRWDDELREARALADGALRRLRASGVL